MYVCTYVHKYMYIRVGSASMIASTSRAHQLTMQQTLSARANSIRSIRIRIGSSSKAYAAYASAVQRHSVPPRMRRHHSDNS